MESTLAVNRWEASKQPFTSNRWFRWRWFLQHPSPSDQCLKTPALKRFSDLAVIAMQSWGRLDMNNTSNSSEIQNKKSTYSDVTLTLTLPPPYLSHSFGPGTFAFELSYLQPPFRKKSWIRPWLWTATARNCNKSFTDIEHRNGAVGRQGLVH